MEIAKERRLNPYLTQEPVRLPAFHGVVEQFAEVARNRFFEGARKDGILAQIKGHFIHEGRATHMIRGDEKPDHVEMKEGKAEVEFKREEINRFTEIDALKAIEQLSEQHKRQMSEALFHLVDDVTKETGNIVHSKGKLSHDAIFSILDKMEHRFSSGPHKSDISMVVGEALFEQVKELEKEYQQSPELQKQHKELMIKKYEQFRDREMDRTLAG